MGIGAHALLRERGTPFAELGLPDPQCAAFNKEDGDAAVNAEGKPVNQRSR